MGPLKGALSLVLYSVATVVTFTLLLPLALLKFLVPPWRAAIGRRADALASAWIDFSNFHQRQITGTELQIEGDLSSLSREQWYLLICNHQSWVDILILIRLFNGRIPYVKFFFKKQLLWVPLFGLALWVLDFPMMRRHSRTQLKRNPGLREQDMEQTRRACQVYRYNPVTVVTFPEGTRFRPAKHKAQGEVYRHLLRPHAGGMAFSLSAMEGRLRKMVDVTINYPDGVPSFWDYSCGRVRRVQLRVVQRTLTEDLLGDYQHDREFRMHFQSWVNDIWREKDAWLDSMREREQGRES
ncbi:acetyltransferase [Marinimicrobium sp. ABcell2]|uniref:acetyltransferase n=1 Tax=Marinimicrobium sp. ABcell2 TaxID=3069751 RepID=UPI0027B1E8D3|nr:acetyltransferase [Marinimicrobium sp. ABcell2]MDQ2077961.1 acetyltransferase [Marinimicrobium sp. ABcell2]